MSRSVSSKKRKRILSQNADDEDSGSPVVSRSTEQREINRKEKRKSAQDLNRPRLNDKSSSNESSSTIVLDENDDDWLEMDVEDEARTLITNTLEHDKSLEHVKVFEDYQKHQQKMRRKSFNNRRNSFMKLKLVPTSPMLSRASSNDFDKYQSCLSLHSEDSFNVKNPSKTYTKSFINSHVEQLERLSDIFVSQNARQPMIEDKSLSKYNWKDAAKPFPLLIIIFLTLGILALAFLKDRNN